MATSLRKVFQAYSMETAWKHILHTEMYFHFGHWQGIISITQINMRLNFTISIFLFAISSCTTETRTTEEFISEEADDTLTLELLQEDTSDINVITKDPVWDSGIKWSVAEQFMNEYVDFLLEEMKSDKDLFSWVDSRSDLTKEFIESWNLIFTGGEAYEIEDEYELDYDPIIDAQDFPDDGFEVVDAFLEDTSVVLQGIGWETFKLKIFLKFEDGVWKVDGSGDVNTGAM